MKKDRYFIDGRYYTTQELREGYRIITGLQNDDEMSNDQVFNYMQDVLKDDCYE